jgi:hypothetical protein
MTNEMGGSCSIVGERRGAYKILIGKPGGKRPLGIPRQRLEGNIKMDLKNKGNIALIGFMWLKIWTSGGPL